MDLASIRSSLNLSQEQLAEKLSISRGHVGDIERGHRRLTVKLAARLEKELPVTGIVDAVMADELKRARAA